MVLKQELYNCHLAVLKPECSPLAPLGALICQLSAASRNFEEGKWEILRIGDSVEKAGGKRRKNKSKKENDTQRITELFNCISVIHRDGK